MRSWLLTLVLLAPTPLLADVTGTGDAMIVEKLTAIFKTANEQLKEFQEMTDISERLKQIEELKQVSKLSAEGEQFKALFREINQSWETLDDIARDPGGFQAIETAIRRLERKAEYAQSLEGMKQAREYSRMLADLKRLHFLQEANDASKQKLGRGVNPEESQQISAANSTIMTDLLLQREQQATMIRLQEQEAVQELLQNANYSAIYGD